MGPVDHLDVDRRVCLIGIGADVETLALFANQPVSAEACLFTFSLCWFDAVAPLCWPDLRARKLHVDSERLAVDGPVGLRVPVPHRPGTNEKLWRVDPCGWT